jgi:hypothetical protein
VAPEIDHPSGRFRRPPARQAFAHQKRDRLFERRILLLGDALVIGLGIFVAEHGVEIVADAGHAPRADRLDACLFDGVVDRAGVGAGRREIGVDPGIVAGLAQSHGVADAARHRNVVAGRPLRKVRQSGALADETRSVIGENDFEFVVGCDRADAAGQRTLERLGIDRAAGPVVLRIVAATCHGPACPFARQCVASSTRLTALSLSSTPKARW